MNHMLAIYTAYNATVNSPDGDLEGTDCAVRSVGHAKRSLLDQAAEAAAEAVAHDLHWEPLLNAIELAHDDMMDAEQALVALAMESVTLTGGVVLARLGGVPIVWGLREHLDGEGGPVAMDLYERLGLEGTGVTVELVDPCYYVGSSQHMTRRVLVRLAPASVEQDPMIDALERVEIALNEKGWSMG